MDGGLFASLEDKEFFISQKKTRSSVASNHTKWFSIMGFTKFYLFDESNDHFLICEL